MVQRDRNWYYEPDALWYEDNGRTVPISDGIVEDSLSNETSGGSGSTRTTTISSNESEWNVVRKKKKKRTINQETPPFNIQELANLTDYAMVMAKYEQPQWRKDLLKTYGPLGMEKEGYNNLSKDSLDIIGAK